MDSLAQLIKTDAKRLSPHAGFWSLIRLVVSSAPFQAALGLRLSSAIMPHAPALARLVARINLWATGLDADPRATIGPSVLFQHPQGLVIGGGVLVGRNATFMSGVVLGRLAIEGQDIAGYPTVGNDVLFGTKSSVLGPVTIGDRCRVGAHSLVLGSYPEDSVIKGQPARGLRA